MKNVEISILVRLGLPQINQDELRHSLFYTECFRYYSRNKEDLNTDDELLPRLNLISVELIERFDLLNCESLEFLGDIPKRIARLNRIRF